MTHRFLFFALLAVSILMGCSGSPDDDRRVKEDNLIERYLQLNNLSYIKQDGVYYAIRNKGFGYQIATNDSIAFLYVGYTLKGEVFDTNILDVALEFNLDTTIRDFAPLETIAGHSPLIPGLNRGLMLCREGELGTLLFPSELGYGSDIMGSLPPWSPIAFDIFIIYVKNPQITQEQKFIHTFVQGSQGFVPDSLGFWIKMLDHSFDESDFTLNDTLFVKISGQSLRQEGNLEPPTKTLKVALNEENLLEGLVYGFLRLQKGEQAQLVLPSCLAFGINGNDTIEPYEPMLYHIQLDSIQYKSVIQ